LFFSRATDSGNTSFRFDGDSGMSAEAARKTRFFAWVVASEIIVYNKSLRERPLRLFGGIDSLAEEKLHELAKKKYSFFFPVRLLPPVDYLKLVLRLPSLGC